MGKAIEGCLRLVSSNFISIVFFELKSSLITRIFRATVEDLPGLDNNEARYSSIALSYSFLF